MSGRSGAEGLQLGQFETLRLHGTLQCKAAVAGGVSLLKAEEALQQLLQHKQNGCAVSGRTGAEGSCIGQLEALRLHGTMQC